jgi:hypothetical protein
MSDSTKIYAATSDDALWLRIEGQAMADVCPSLKTFCEARLTIDRPKLNVVLTCCNHFDSTFLGTLLCLQKIHGRAGGESIELIAPGDPCHDALKRMQAHQLFPINMTDSLPDLDWTLIAASAADRQSHEFQQQVLDAHVELAAVPGPLGELYEPIARMAEKEFESRTAASSRS